MIWPKEVTLVSRTQPLGPLCLWQCFCIYTRLRGMRQICPPPPPPGQIGLNWQQQENHLFELSWVPQYLHKKISYCFDHSALKIFFLFPDEVLTRASFAFTKNRESIFFVSPLWTLIMRMKTPMKVKMDLGLKNTSFSGIPESPLTMLNAKGSKASLKVQGTNPICT